MATPTAPADVTWFDENVVKNGADEPLVLYHATNSARMFSQFRVSPRGNFGSGIYLASTLDQAECFLGEDEHSRILEVHVAMRRPFYTRADYNEGEDVDVDSPAIPLLREVLGDRANVAIARLRNSADGHFGRSVRNQLELWGHDGIVAVYNDQSAEYVAFEARQIRIARSIPGIDYLREKEKRLKAAGLRL